MINFDRNRFNEMTTSEKIAFVNDLVTKNTLLTKEEMYYLSPENREKYLFNRVRTSEWLEDYEFDNMSDEEKKIYMSQKRYLQGIDIKKLTDDLQRDYIDSAISSGIQLTDEEFDGLHSDDIKKYYVEEKLLHSTITMLNSEELSYLDSDKQKKYLNNLNRMGMAPNVGDFKFLKPEAIRFYLTHNRVNEIRSIVRSELKKILK
jgi:hypothetical protein